MILSKTEIDKLEDFIDGMPFYQKKKAQMSSQLGIIRIKKNYKRIIKRQI